MKIDSGGEYTIGISQKDKRCFPISSDYKYSNITVQVIEDSGNDMTDLDYMDGVETYMKRDTYIEFKNLP